MLFFAFLLCAFVFWVLGALMGTDHQDKQIEELKAEIQRLKVQLDSAVTS